MKSAYITAMSHKEVISNVKVGIIRYSQFRIRGQDIHLSLVAGRKYVLHILIIIRKSIRRQQLGIEAVNIVCMHPDM